MSISMDLFIFLSVGAKASPFRSAQRHRISVPRASRLQPIGPVKLPWNFLGLLRIVVAMVIYILV